jgi:histidyl-tRNA synthetase
VFVVDTTGGLEALAITEEVRRAGRSADRAYDNRSMKAQMKAADRSGAAVAVIVGDDERAAGTALVRPLRRHAGETQSVVTRADLLSHLEATLRA